MKEQMQFEILTIFHQDHIFQSGRVNIEIQLTKK